MKDVRGDVGEDGKTIPYSKMDKVFAIIDSLDLTPEQKDVLAMAGWDSSNDGYAEKNLKRAPWHDGSTDTSKSTKKKSSGRSGRGGGGRRGGGRKRGGGKAAPGYDPGLILPTANGKSWNYNRIMDLWKKRRYSRAQILAAMRAGLISQEEAEEILATVQESMIEPDTADGMTDGSLELGAAEELESA